MNKSNQIREKNQESLIKKSAYCAINSIVF